MNIVTANYKPEYFHNFSEGEFLIKVIDSNKISNFYVEEVISTSKIKVSSIDVNGNLSGTSLIVKGKDIHNYISNSIANKIEKQIKGASFLGS